MRIVTAAQARRIALAAQGFGAPRPTVVTMRQVQSVIDRLGQFQIDTINVVERAHYLPVFSRLGSYDTALIDRALGESPRRLFEYWGHAASMIDVRLEPALRPRMAANKAEEEGRLARIEAQHPGLVGSVLAELEQRGPLTSRQIEHDEVRERSNWGWNWSAVKTTLEALFGCGQVTSAGRNRQFERRYDLPTRVIPAAVRHVSTPTLAEAHVELTRRAAQGLGVGTLRCLADYFRTRHDHTAEAIATLVAAGELEPVRVEGWKPDAWLWAGAKRPRSITTRALVSPFDSLIFERARALALFGLDYRIEIYVPEAKRQYGYYVYPFLLDEQFAARVDLKADRRAGVLRVQSAWIEPGTTQARGRVVTELAAALHELASWQGLTDVAVAGRGDLAADLGAVV